ncbi:MAG TPA: rRNA adenine N-6-methyltransferase family protein, partial [Smithella sp.]|nr:rRNA adenine N-6-methyltransferase family protein [Smithella sp.]
MLLPSDILHHYCIKPRKSLGQCFLVDQDRMAQIVQLADAKKDDVVVEIGAGIGVLTQSLAERAARVIAV